MSQTQKHLYYKWIWQHFNKANKMTVIGGVVVKIAESNESLVIIIFFWSKRVDTKCTGRQNVATKSSQFRELCCIQTLNNKDSLLYLKAAGTPESM